MRFHIGGRHDDESARASIKELAQILQVRPAHPGSDMTRRRADRSSRGTSDRKGRTDRYGREQRHDRTYREPHGEPADRALAGRFFHLLDDLDLPLRVLGHDRRVIRVDDAEVFVRGANRVVVIEGVFLECVLRGDQGERVQSHGPCTPRGIEMTSYPRTAHASMDITTRSGMPWIERIRTLVANPASMR